jgi:tryptophan synthase alpha chain
MSAIAETFQSLKAEGNGALIGYVMAGDPKLELTPKIASALVKGGVDMLELGLPFSDPIADGPTIQAAGVRALAAGTTPKTVLDVAKEVKKTHTVPVVIMTYCNPVFKMGLERFFGHAEDCQIDGVIIPDLPLEEADEYRKAATAHNIDSILLAAPSTDNKRLERIVASASGFLYLVSRFGVTGSKSQVAESTISLVKRVQQFTIGKIPLAVGFGVSKAEHVRQILAAGADGVIVGSAFVDLIRQHQADESKMLRALEKMAHSLKEATRG